jgi:hypothetical protein
MIVEKMKSQDGPNDSATMLLLAMNGDQFSKLPHDGPTAQV